MEGTTLTDYGVLKKGENWQLTIYSVAYMIMLLYSVAYMIMLHIVNAYTELKATQSSLIEYIWE